MGVVYKARDTRLDRVVALKFLGPGLVASAEAHDRSMSEARAIAALNHPNIATIYEIGESAGAPVLVLEYLPGGTLRSRIDARVLSSGEIVEYGLQNADGNLREPCCLRHCQGAFSALSDDAGPDRRPSALRRCSGQADREDDDDPMRNAHDSGHRRRRHLARGSGDGPVERGLPRPDSGQRA